MGRQVQVASDALCSHRFTKREDVSIPINKDIENLDRRGMRLIESLDVGAFMEYLEQTKNTICGRNPIVLLLATLEAMEGSARVSFVHYAQSGSVTSEAESSVSYAAGVVELAI